MVLQVFGRRGEPALSDEAKRFLESLPPAFVHVFRKRRRLLPVWSHRRYCVMIKSTFLIYYREDAAVTASHSRITDAQPQQQQEHDHEPHDPPTTLSKEKLHARLKFVNLQNCKIRLVDDDSAGFVFCVTPASGKGGIMFAADSEKDRARFAATAAAAQLRVPPAGRDLQTLKLLGKGHYGRVLLARHAKDGALYAVKEMKLGQVKPKVAYAERSVMEWVGRHPFLLPLDFAMARGRSIFLLSPFMPGGDLFVHMQQHGGSFDENVVRFYGAELVLALEHMHQMSIVHRDIKPENVLLGLDGHIKLADMGLAKRLEARSARTTTMCGTDTYLPPEMILRGAGGHGLPVDLWQLGCILFELRAGYPPFYLPQSSQKATHQRILQLPVRYPSNMSPELKDLLARLLQKRPEDRLGFTTGVSDVKSHAFFRGVDWDAVLRMQVAPPLMPRAVTPDNLVANFDRHFTDQPHQLYMSDEFGDDLARDFAGFDFCRPASDAEPRGSRCGTKRQRDNHTEVTANDSFLCLSAHSTDGDDDDDKPEIELDADAVRIKI